MRPGDTVKYNAFENCLIVSIDRNNALVRFKSGTTICTRLSGLLPIPGGEAKEVMIKEPQLKLFSSPPTDPENKV